MGDHDSLLAVRRMSLIELQNYNTIYRGKLVKLLFFVEKDTNKELGYYAVSISNTK